MSAIIDKTKEYMKHGYNLSEAYAMAKSKNFKPLLTDERIQAIRRKNQEDIDNWNSYGLVKAVIKGQHINIECKKCGTKGITKNIAPLGCRTLFINCQCENLNNLRISQDQDINWNDYTWLR